MLNKLQAKHNLLLKLILVVIVSIIAAKLIPIESDHNLKLGAFDKVWNHDDLILEQDLFEKKSESEIESEKAILLKQLPSVFVFNNEEREEKLAQLELLRTKNLKQYETIKKILDEIYDVGVIENIELKSDNPVVVLDGSEAKTGLRSYFFSLNEAYDELLKRCRDNKLDLNEVELSDYLTINLFFNQSKTTSYNEMLLQSITDLKLIISKGEVIIRKGETLSEENKSLINKYLKTIQKQTIPLTTILIGRIGFVMVLSLTLLLYLFFFRKVVFGHNKQVAFLYLVILTVFSCSYLLNKYQIPVFFIPFVLVPVIIRVFFDSRTALFTHLISILFCSFFVYDKLEFITIQLIVGIGVLFSISEMRKRQQLINASFVAILFYVLLFVLYEIGFNNAISISKLQNYFPFVVSGSLVLFASPIIYLMEKLFGFVSDFKFLELCDLNQPLLRKLSQEVPGTFQHSLQVANLAEEAIYYIGGSTLLVRAGAMYHDIGKMYNPDYFIENQAREVSPHILMQPKESAQIIINHVIKGIEMAKAHKLPEQIIDFIRTHHGTTTVGFFLGMEKKELGTENINEDDFKYPGPIPFNKETAVLMLADGVEAASRSLKKHDAYTINDLVDKVIDYKINQNQLINADITYKDITLIRKIFKKRLITIYHARIEYPS